MKKYIKVLPSIFLVILLISIQINSVIGAASINYSLYEGGGDGGSTTSTTSGTTACNHTNKQNMYSSYNSSQHYTQVCTSCGMKFNLANHSWNIGSATCTVDKKCNRCGYIIQRALGHNYVNGKCTRCGLINECSENGIIPSHRNYLREYYKWDYEYDEAGYNTHSLWLECTKCKNNFRSSTSQKQQHVLDNKGKCKYCSYEEHVCDQKVKIISEEESDLTYHTWRIYCSGCDELQGTTKEEHTAPNKDGKCDACGTKLVYEPEAIYLNKNAITLDKGKTFQLEAEIVPAIANKKDRVTYTSNSPSVASVNYSSGLVTAKGVGKATITARTDNGKTAKCTVTVKVCGKDYTVSGHYGSKTISFTNITSTTHDAVIKCTKCGTSYTNKSIGHKYLNNNGTECPCGYKCAHSGEKSTTYTKKVYATHTKVVRCTVCKTEINSISESHKFNEFGICDCGYKCPHTGETKKDYQPEIEMVHKEITKCANCGKIIDTVRIPKTSNVNDEFDSTYTYISNNKHKIYLKCKTCNFTYNGEGSCRLEGGSCKFCHTKITMCSDKTHNHKLVCDGKSTPYHKLYYKCDKLNITWEYDRDKMNLLIQSGEDICIACNKCMHISKKTNYITDADGHIKQEVCKNSKCNKTVSTSARENHKFENGVCTVCDYKCKHRKTTKKYENVNIENCKVKEICDTCGSITKEFQIQHKIKNNKCENCNAEYNKCSLGDKHIHSYNVSAATCILDKKCKTCDYVESKALGHNYVDGKCTRCGLINECSENGIIPSHRNYLREYYKWDYEYDEAGYNTHSLWLECTKCKNNFRSSTSQKQQHVLDNKGKCKYCSYEEHVCDQKVKIISEEESDLTYHTWRIYCSGCDELQGTTKEEHTAPNKDGKCDACGTKLVYEPEAIYLNKNAITLDKGKTFQLEAEIVPAIANKKDRVTYTSNSPSVASVNYSSGLVTAKGVGKATVTARTDNGKTAKCTVTVKVCGKDYTISEHASFKEYSFTNITSTTHDAVIKCTKCGTSYTNRSIKHTFENGVCTACEYQCRHENTTNEVKYKNENEHTIFAACTNCDVTKEVKDELHDKNLELLNVNWTNKEKHNILVKCSCGKFSKTEEHKYDDKTGECICGMSKDEEKKKCSNIRFTSQTIQAKVGTTIPLKRYLRVDPAGAEVKLKWSTSIPNAVVLRANGVVTFKEKANNIQIRVVDMLTGKSATIRIRVEGSTIKEPENKEYVDVSKDSWYKENVDKATSEGMFNGVSDDKFAPEDNVTRGMFVTALARMDKADTKGYANLFDDVSDKAYYSESIAWASVNGIVDGIGNGKFAPEALMTREEMAVMIRNYINVQYNDVHLNTELASISTIETFADDDKISSWAKGAVYSLAEIGLLNGKGNGNFAPQDKVTRAEAATILVRLSEKMTVNIVKEQEN